MPLHILTAWVIWISARYWYLHCVQEKSNPLFTLS